MTTATAKQRLHGEWFTEPRNGKLKGTNGQRAVEIWSGPRNLVDAEYVGTVAEDAAPLIAAAPQLLEACRAALRVIDECVPVTQPVPVPGVSVQLRAAIAAATR